MNLYKPISNTKALLVTTVVLAIGFALLTIWSDHIFRIPLSETVGTDPPSSLQRRITIPVFQEYQLELLFQREGRVFEEMNRLVGGQSSGSSGVTIPVTWSIHDASTQEYIVGDELDTIGATGYSSRWIHRRFAEFTLEPGEYDFRFVITDSVPAYSEGDMEIVMFWNIKHNKSKQVQYAFLLHILAPWVLILWFMWVITTFSIWLYRRFQKRRNRT